MTGFLIKGIRIIAVKAIIKMIVSMMIIVQFIYSFTFNVSQIVFESLHQFVADIIPYLTAHILTPTLSHVQDKFHSYLEYKPESY